MHLVLVTERWLPTLTPHVERLVLLRTALQHRGHRVTVVTPMIHGVTRADAALIEIPAMPLPGSSGLHFSLPGLIEASPLFSRADVLLLAEPLALAAWAVERALPYHLPSLLFDDAPTADAPVTSHVVHQVTAVIVGASARHAALRAQGIEGPIHVLPPIVPSRTDQADPHWLHRTLSLPVATPLVITRDSHQSRPNTRLLVDSIVRMEEKPHLVIVADHDVLHRQAEDAVYRHRAGGHIHILPQPTPSAIHHLDAGATVATSCATAAHPDWLYQTAAAGVPALVVSHPVIHHVTNRQTGIIAQPTQTSVIRGLRQLLHRPALRTQYGQAAQRSIEQHHSATTVAGRFEDILHLTKRLVGVEA